MTRSIQRWLPVIALQFCFFTAAGHAQVQTCPVVRVRQGLLQGACDAKVASYKGIPYAQPPVGDLRWRPPQPPAAWTGKRLATDFSASCIQDLQRERLPWTKPFMAQNSTSEDCLTLNVWTPRTASLQGWPVYLFIHGGGYVEGSSEVSVYDGRHLAMHGVVVVTINYRLGLLGFFAYPELTAESPHHASGDYGIMDVIAALRWVQQNIRVFGGDPSRVTIGGQSAGAGIVHVLSASPLAKGLFENAIAESGSGIRSPVSASQPLAQAEQTGVRIAKTLGISSLAELRKLPADDFLPSRFAAPAMRPSVDIDGWVLPDSEERIFAAGRENQAHWITGMQADEGSSGKSYGKLTAEEFRKQSEQRLGELSSRFLELYLPENHESQIQSARDRGMVSTYFWALKIAKTNKLPIYLYYFSEPTPWPEHPEFAAFHSSELPYDLDNLDKADHPYGEVDRAISRRMVEYWTDFFRSGDPNGPSLPSWQPFRPSSAVILDIGPTAEMRPLMSKDKLNFWTDYFNSPVSGNALAF